MRPWIALVCGLMLLLSPAGAGAGPWPRDAGSWFIAPAVGLETTRGIRLRILELYGEYGLAPRITAATKLRFELPANDWRDGRAELDSTLRWHPRFTPLGLHLGLEAGLRAELRRNPDPQEIDLFEDVFVEENDLQPGLTALARVHVGRSIDTVLGPGWARVTLAMHRPIDLNLERYYIVEDSRPSTELVAQVGIRPTEDWLGMLTVSAWRSQGDRALKVSPAIGRRLAPGREVVLELTAEPGRSRGTRGLTVALWQQF